MAGNRPNRQANSQGSEVVKLCKSKQLKAMPNSEFSPSRSLPIWSRIVLGLIAAYLLAAYVIMPWLDKTEVRHDPALYENPRLTHTGTGLAGDPLNIELVGTEEDVIRAMAAAGWFPADPLTFRSSVRIVADTVFKKPDDDATVSSLFLYGRKEDLAFELPAGDSPKERHHVRFWRSENLVEGRPVWMGSAAYDMGVELSRTTGEVTHHIFPAVDLERDLLLADLTKGTPNLTTKWIDGYHTELQGKNGGGDLWKTDGRLAVAELPGRKP